MNQIIIYGAGNTGIKYYEVFQRCGMEDMIYAFCDRNYMEIKKIGEVPVYPYEELEALNIPFIIAMAMHEEVCERLENAGNIYYVNLEKWIQDYIKNDMDRIKLQIVYSNLKTGECESEGILNNLDKGIFENINALKLDKAVKIYGGTCPCCKKNTLFISHHYWLRDHYKCLFCKSIPRQRALMKVLETEVPAWRNLRIHESSPSGPTFHVLKQQCSQYTYSYWYEEKALGESLEGDIVTNQNLENMIFEDNVFDVFLTQDVLEHVNEPDKVFPEIARVLKKGGVHIFTTPLYPFRKTISRIQMERGKRECVLPPIYHMNPVDQNGSLVTYEWGYDFLDLIDKNVGMESKIIEFPNSKENFENGLEADFLQVIVSKKI